MDDEQLIEAVQRRRAIYDKNHPKHRNRDTLRMLWSECAAELDTVEVERIKRRWGYLRDYFLKQLRDIKAAPPGAAKKRKWPLFNSLTFLIPHEHYDTLGSFQGESQSLHSESKSSEEEMLVQEMHVDDKTLALQEVRVHEEPSGDTDSLHDEPPHSSTVSMIRKRPFTVSMSRRPSKRRVPDEPSQYDLEVLSPSCKEHEPCDDDDHFFKSLKPMLQQLDPLQKLEFRTEVQKLLMQLLRPSSSTP
ncbi:hypothetical protein Pcinc_027716 [Petrolisthes cinctipes]|uniref:Transcription factor Adf-1 n=1 Tax=Petrolisthes cinctipes TaxID=88211 RepID=A0AAE1F4I1_PETCI|nr:hypothetical protein Pcinc_027716 [Petrolisthes cinctipes]